MPPDPLTLYLSRGAVAFVWFYHGLAPKLLGPDAAELRMAGVLGLSDAMTERASQAAGVLEMLFALCVVLFWRSTWPLWISLALMPLLLVFAAATVPDLLMASFNPVSTNVCVAALSAIALRQQHRRSR